MCQWSRGAGRAYRWQERPPAARRGNMGAITPQGVGRAGNRSPAKGGRFHRPGPSSFPGCCCAVMVGGRPVRLLGVSKGPPCHFGGHEKPTAATSGPKRPEQGRGLGPPPKKGRKRPPRACQRGESSTGPPSTGGGWGRSPNEFIYPSKLIAALGVAESPPPCYGKGVESITKRPRRGNTKEGFSCSKTRIPQNGLAFKWEIGKRILCV